MFTSKVSNGESCLPQQSSLMQCPRCLSGEPVSLYQSPFSGEPVTLPLTVSLENLSPFPSLFLWRTSHTSPHCFSGEPITLPLTVSLENQSYFPSLFLWRTYHPYVHKSYCKVSTAEQERTSCPTKSQFLARYLLNLFGHRERRV